MQKNKVMTENTRIILIMRVATSLEKETVRSLYPHMLANCRKFLEKLKNLNDKYKILIKMKFFS